MRWFLDSYAIIEMARGSSHYSPYRRDSSVTSSPQLLEAFYILLEQGYEELAIATLARLSPITVHPPLTITPSVARFRLRRKGATGRRFSYAGAMGYVYARERGYAFLTGDHEFEGLPGVEFVR